LYKSETALYKYAFDQRGFEWVDYSDRENSVIVYMRKADQKEDLLIVVCNFTPSPRSHYRVGVPFRGQWKEVFNSDETDFGGSGVLNHGLLMTSPVKFQGKDYSISLTLPPLAVTVLKLEKEINEFELE
jgi:1,4-alpha-glucan branching enzyme